MNTVGVTFATLIALGSASCATGSHFCDVTVGRPAIDVGSRWPDDVQYLNAMDGFTGRAGHMQIAPNRFRVEADVTPVAAIMKRPDVCWAAAIETVMNYYGVPLDQCDVLKQVGGDCNSSEIQTASQCKLVSGLNRWQVSANGRPVLVQATSLLNYNGLPLLDDLSLEKPIVVGIRNQDYPGGHVFVLTAIEYSWNPQFGNTPIFQELDLYDPDPDVADTVTMSGAEFVRSVSFATRIAVTQ